MFHQRKGTPYKPLLSYDAVEQKGKASKMHPLLSLAKLWFHSTVVADFIPAAALIVIISRNSMKHGWEWMCHPSKGNQTAQWNTMFQDFILTDLTPKAHI